MTETTQTVDALFVGKDAVVSAIYHRLIEVLHTLGPFQEEPKKTSIHLVHTSGFAGIHPRKSFLYLNLRMDRLLQGERVAKSEQVSKNRYHNEVKIATPDEVDGELIAWLKEAYVLA
ncbi:DUF5655 domain-containing protein [Kouleothrix sp.]|uniref:DUF5655 domain-containing protein n=1 Tax=Kouleothrix sp. TaxID=2779161 RepID=UPI003919AE24